MKTILGIADSALIFVSVATEGSFTRAAAHLGCSKAHVSSQLAALELDLGIQLVHRTTRRLILTDAGRLYLEYAKQLQETLVEAERAVSSTRSEVSGQLRISAPTSFSELVLPELLMGFCETYPNIKPVVDVTPVHHDLRDQKFDVAFRATHRLDDYLVARPIGVVQERVVATPGLIEAAGTVDDPADLVHLPCLVNSHFGDSPHWLFAREGERKSVTVSGPFVANTYQAIHRFALMGAGVAKLPLFMVAQDIAQGRLQLLCSDWAAPTLPLYVVYAGQRHLPLRIRAFVDFVVQWFGDDSRRCLFS